jgi:dipeptidyl aminopeptidase/acylaminoacyl peptidase
MPEKRNLAMIAKQYPNLDEENLGQVYPLRYAARDGLEIPAYVTLPHGLTPDSAEALPFVVLPHGGPHARDFRRFDWMAQMLANAGYGVLQMNFRGSTGHGVAFEKAGRKEWGQAMVNDVTDRGTVVDCTRASGSSAYVYCWSVFWWLCDDDERGERTQPLSVRCSP